MSGSARLLEGVVEWLYEDFNRVDDSIQGFLEGFGFGMQGS